MNAPSATRRAAGERSRRSVARPTAIAIDLTAIATYLKVDLVVIGSRAPQGPGIFRLS